MIFQVTIQGVQIAVSRDSDGTFIIPEYLRGLGTNLKPAHEMWWLVRKPLGEKTVAANVLKHGTGGLNIDGCRIAVSQDDPNHRKPNPNMGSGGGHHFSFGKLEIPNLNNSGRFPANLILSHNPDCADDCSDGCAVAALDEQSGILKPGGQKRGNRAAKGVCTDFSFKVESQVSRKDSGGASRFFYVAKASKRDKGTDNKHPTVKSTKLMEYLIRLVTPPGGTVLDPFMGSGSTGVAATKLQFGFVGIEQEPEYFQIAANRIA